MLRTSDMDDDRREHLEEELEDLKKILKMSEQEIAALNFANRETTKIAAAVMFFLVFIFCIYALFNNTNWAINIFSPNTYFIPLFKSIFETFTILYFYTFAF